MINYNGTNEKYVESGAGEGKETKDESKKDDSKKTLSDQVADGKYGLIHKELFQTKPKRPGIISYAPNPEVPNDSSSNYGGLSEDEIWLAEDHLLVLKGGNLNDPNDREPWKPIDDYEAPPRQVKIPNNPAVPPPFPVQLEENGPIQFIGNNQLPLVNPFTNETILLFSEDGFPKTETYSPDKTNVFARPGATELSKINNGNNHSADAHLSGRNNFTFSNPFLSPFPPEFVGPPRLPFYTNGSLENSNITDFIDDDDPSFFYPPPYTFFYKRNYTNAVEPGPLVPGIILPPPPHFFGRLNPTPSKNSTRNESFAKTTVRPSKQFLRPIYRPSVSTEKPTSTKVTHPPKVRIITVEPLKSYVTTTTSTTSTTLAPITLPTRASTLPPKNGRITQLTKINNPEIIAFVPKDAIDSTVKSNKGKPIYYEYFDARDKIRTTTSTPRPSIKQQLTPVKSIYRRPYNAYLPIKSSFTYEKQKNKAVAENVVKLDDVDEVGLQPPQSHFTSEIENIRNTIEFFKTQQQQQQNVKSTTADPSPLRNPKTKGIFEYSFDVTSPKVKSKKTFNPPVEFDLTPFKPMVNYSPPLNANNGFKGIPYTTVPTLPTETVGSTTTERPTQPSSVTGYYTTVANYPGNKVPNGRHYNGVKSNLRYIPIDTSLLQSLPLEAVDPALQPNIRLPSKRPTFSPSSTTKPPFPWYSVEQQILKEVQPKEINVQIQSHTPTVSPNVSPYESAYVNANTASHPINAFYQSTPTYTYTPSTTHKPMTLPVKSIQQNSYLRQIDWIRREIDRIRSNVTTFSAYRQPRPLLPPHDHNGFVPSYHYTAHKYPQLSDILTPNYPHSQQQQNLPQPPIHTLHKDILVNYKYPLPPINPDSEFLPPPEMLPPIPPPLSSTPVYYNRYGRLHRQPTVVRYKLPGDQQAGVYFYTPQEDDKFSAPSKRKK